MKRFVPLILSAAMAVSTVTPVLANGYVDTNNSWAKAEIDEWSANGVVNGYNGEFRPNASITRAEMATIVDNIMEYQVENTNTFSDVNSDAWYADAILKNNAAGTIVGSNGEARPNDKITREEAVVVLCRALSIEPISGSTGFADDSSVSSWAKGYVAALAQKGLVSGKGGNKFDPKANITRAEVVKIIDNSIQGFYTTAGTYSQDVTGTVVVNESDVELKDMTIAGDLIIAAGVDDGDIVLENVTVTGSLIVEGGGENSIKLLGQSKVNDVKTQKVSDHGVRIFVDEKASVKNITTNGNSQTIIGGKGNIENVKVNGGQGVKVSEETKVNNMTVNVNVTIQVNGTVVNCTIANGLNNVAVTGSGAIVTISINSKGVNVEVKVDNVKVADGLNNVTVGGKDVSTGNSNTSTGSGSAGGSGGGGSSTGGGDTTNGGDETDNGGDETDNGGDETDVTDTTAPEVKISVSNITSSSAIVLLTSNEEGIYSYKVTDANENVVNSGSGNLSSRSNSVRIKGLNPSSTYTFSLVATDASENEETFTKSFSTLSESGKDEVAPIISKISVSYIATTGVTNVKFTSDEAGAYDAVVLYDGVNTEGGISLYNQELVEGTNNVELKNINANTKYPAKIIARDKDGNEAEYSFEIYNEVEAPIIDPVEDVTAPFISFVNTSGSAIVFNSDEKGTYDYSITKTLQNTSGSGIITSGAGITLNKGANTIEVDSFDAGFIYTVKIIVKDIYNNIAEYTKDFTTNGFSPISVSEVTVDADSVPAVFKITADRSIAKVIINGKSIDGSNSSTQTITNNTATSYSTIEASLSSLKAGTKYTYTIQVFDADSNEAEVTGDFETSSEYFNTSDLFFKSITSTSVNNAVVEIESKIDVPIVVGFIQQSNSSNMIVPSTKVYSNLTKGTTTIDFTSLIKADFVKDTKYIICLWDSKKNSVMYHANFIYTNDGNIIITNY